MIFNKPFENICLDTFTYKGTKFLTIIDSFSKYAQAYHIKAVTATEILNKLRHFISHHDRPKRITCDQGKEFKNNAFEEYLTLLNIDLHFTTPHNPNSNAFIERFHSTIIEKLRVLNVKEPKEKPWNQMITAIWIYNQSIHSTTGYSPFSILYGPYKHELDFSLSQNLYEDYNLKRQNEIQPFLDQIRNKMLNKETNVLTKRNETREPNIDLTNENEIYLSTEARNKHSPRYKKLNIINQQDTTVNLFTKNNQITSSNVQKIKRVRNKPLFQVTDGHSSGSSNTPN